MATYAGCATDIRQIFKNRKAIKQELNLPSDPYWLKQEHTTHTVEIDLDNLEPVADAAFTQEKNVICAVLTADCLPLLFCDEKGAIVGAIHAGWRGLLCGIIIETLQRAVIASAPKIKIENLLVWLGPAISPKAFIVGDEVRRKFLERDAENAGAFTYFAQNKWRADLYFLARRQLKKLGVNKIFGGDFCTYTEEDLFFSYRREKELAGRMASLIYINAGRITNKNPTFSRDFSTP